MAVVIVANSMAVETQRNHKLRAYIVQLYENDRTVSVADNNFAVMSTLFYKENQQHGCVYMLCFLNIFL